jgi:predicted CopG family antitoxin
MATKTVSLNESAYEKLKGMKESGESFSDLVERIASERSLTEIAGIWEDDELERKVEKTRKKTERELDETAKRLEE